MNRAKRKIEKRPAESSALLAAGIVAALAVFGVEVDEAGVVAIIVAIGALPSFVSGLVDRFER